jgi:protein-tyrosine kinase
MERISRALELARAQRDGRAGAIADSARRDPTLQDTAIESVELHAVKNGAERSLEKQGEIREAPAQSGEASYRTPAVALDANLRDRERLLQQGSPGADGAPYKMLRTQVLKRLDQLGANTLAMISPTSGAGKTLTAINLAIAIASDPSYTALLVDFDLRNPCVHRRFGYEPKVGVEECLTGQRPLHEAMVKVQGYDRLTLVCARESVENSSELLRSQRTADLVFEMRTRYANRFVVFDLPPVLQADDALAFSRCIQAGLLVVGENHSRREDVTRSIELLRELPIVGTVLNRSRQKSRVHY